MAYGLKKLALPLASVVLIQASNLATGVVLARGLGPSVRGEVAGIAAITITSATILGFSLSEGIVYWLSSKPQIRNEIWLAGFLLTFGFGVISTAVTGIALLALSKHEPIRSLSGWFLYPILSQLALFSVSILRASQNNTSWSLIRGTPVFFYAAYLIIWASLGSLSVFTAGICASLGQISTICIALYFGRPFYLTLTGVEKKLKMVLSFAVRIHPAALTAIAREQGDKFVLFLFVPASELGRYVIGVAIGTLVVASTTTIEQALFPSLASEHDDDRRYSRSVSCVRLLIWVLILGACVFLPLAPAFAGVMFGIEYTRYPYLIIATAMVGFLVSIKILLNLIIKAANRPGVVGVNEAAGLTVLCVSLPVLVWKCGVIGAPIAGGISNLASIIFTLVFLLRRANGFNLLNVFPRASDIINLV